MTANPCPLGPASLDAACASLLACARAALENDPGRSLDQALDDAAELLLKDSADPVFVNIARRLCRHYLSAAARRPRSRPGHPDFVPHLLAQVLPRAWRDAIVKPVPAVAATRAALAVLTEMAAQLQGLHDFGGDPPAGDEAPYGPLAFGQCLDKALLQVAHHQFPGAASLHGELLARLALGQGPNPYRPGTYQRLDLDRAISLTDRAFEMLRLNHEYLTG